MLRFRDNNTNSEETATLQNPISRSRRSNVEELHSDSFCKRLLSSYKRIPLPSAIRKYKKMKFFSDFIISFRRTLIDIMNSIEILESSHRDFVIKYKPKKWADKVDRDSGLEKLRKFQKLTPHEAQVLREYGIAVGENDIKPNKPNF